MKNDAFFEELAGKILCGKADRENMESVKSVLARRHRLSRIPKNAQLIEWVEKQNFSEKEMEILKKALQTKPVRTGSGVSVIAVMAMGECPGKCIYCPKGEDAPQSYTGVEPATMRARRVKYDPYLQVSSRIRQLEITGHPTEKCEIIIMGGTFLAMPKTWQENFVKKCFDAMNSRFSANLKKAHEINENAKHKCVGLTIETRPDYSREKEIRQMLKLGATRVELGVQTTDDRILKLVNRGHATKETIEATRLLRDSGLKVCYHIMPGLSGLFGKIDIEYEKKIIDELFSNPDFKPDMLKVYPVLVIPGTRLCEIWKKEKYEPMSIAQAREIMMHIKQTVPEWVRIQRMQRDISSKKIVAGPNLTNIRQKVLQDMEKKGIKCRCIRCREVGRSDSLPKNITLMKTEYDASEGKEIFLSFEDRKREILIGYLRLRMPYRPFIPYLRASALVRELHVYGQEVPVGKREENEWQHRGYGKALVDEAEKISKEMGFKKISITSGVGVRQYYRRLGYKLKGFHMVKILK